MNKEILKEQIKRHEGEVLEIYKDSLGYLTFGVGHLVREDDPEFGEPEGTPVSQNILIHLKLYFLKKDQIYII